MISETNTLENMCELVVDCPHFTPKWTDNGLIVIRNQNIKGGTLDLSNPSYTNEGDFQKRIKRAGPQVGDIVFTREAPMGEVCLIPEGLKCCLGQRQVLLRPKKEVNGKYLFWALQSPYVQQQISWNEGTGSTVSNVRIPVLKNLNIPRHKGNEDQIADILSSIADKISINRQINQTLESMAQAIFKSWFVDFEPVKAKIAAIEAGEAAEDVTCAAMRAISGKTDDELNQLQARQPKHYAQLKTTAELFPSAMQDSELGDIPERWGVLTFDEFVSRSNERVGTQDVPEYSSTNDGLKLRSETFNKQLSKNRSNNKLIRKNDLVFGLSRQILNFGLMQDEIGAVSPVYNVFSINTKMIVSDFVEKYIRERMNFYYGMINGSSREGQSISVKQFLKMPFLIPPLKVQEELYSYLQLISKRINQIKCEINILSELRDTLLSKLLSGELSVNAAELAEEY
jgi:type I restriction enzyme S subunit